MIKRDKMSYIGKRADVNMVAASVRIAGGALRVAHLLGVSRSQVYRWINAGTMAHATYLYVAKLSRISGIDMRLLGGDESSLSNRPLPIQTDELGRKIDRTKPHLPQAREDLGTDTAKATLGIDDSASGRSESMLARVKNKLAAYA
jgi:hypothetical protein